MRRKARIDLFVVLLGCVRPNAPATVTHGLEFTIVDAAITIDVALPNGTHERYQIPRLDRAAPLSSILRVPDGIETFRLRGPPTFSAALPRDGDAYLGSVQDLGAPFAFGPRRTLGALDVVMLPGQRASTDDDIAAWLQRALHNVSVYYARPPFAKMLVIVESANHDEIFGLADHHGAGSITLMFGPDSRVDGDDDWVATHEMLHFAYPFVGREQPWFSEGMATYVEAIARARSGDVDERTTWTDLAHGLAKGGTGPSDSRKGTYWGGALYYFAVDVELRVRTNNQKGLEHALRPLHGGSASIDEVIDRADAATGTTVFRDLYDKPIALAPMLARLGVVRNGDSVTFDNTAPLAHVRRAITKRDG